MSDEARNPTFIGAGSPRGDVNTVERAGGASLEASRELPAFAQDTTAVLAALRVDPERGLSVDEVAERQRSHGPNALQDAPPIPAWRQFVAQFEEPVVLLLIAAGVLAGLLGETADVIAILAIVILNAVLGFVQQRRAEAALAALRRMSAPSAKVIRGGQLQVVAARDVVPGDCIELEAGDQIPADARLLSGFGFRATEAALTGESTPSDKHPQAVLPESTDLGSRVNMVYSGTVVAAGKASAVVVATGMRTELGRIAGLLRAQPQEITPLQRRLARLGRDLVLLCLALVAIIAGLQLLRGSGWIETLHLAVSLAVAAVPEGLPAVVTITLALGVQRMVRRNALIRRLASVETLGSVTVICSDKTGTLTRNEMTVRELWAGDGRYRVTGGGYEPHGAFLADSEEPASQPTSGGIGASAAAAPLRQALMIGGVCNHSQVVMAADGNGWQAIGDTTEAALLVVARKAGLGLHPEHFALLGELPFDSDRKAMSVVVRQPAGLVSIFTKGAPEVILGKCSQRLTARGIEPLTSEERQRLQAVSDEMAARALRVIGLAYRDQVTGDVVEHLETDLVFAGFAGMIDPPRDEVRDAVRRCREAGIRPVMITGDHPATALAIAGELGIVTASATVVAGHELERLSDPQLEAIVGQTAVYARVTAEHKLRVVRALKAQGAIVAMTGDGVNDAPAVKAADIGVAMGITGTDVTKEASAMVLTDDNFVSIVNAVEEGRGIYDNICKFVGYLLAGNAGKLLVMFVAAIFHWPTPLLPLQILWLNLVTDGLAALALGLERTESAVMRRPPRSPQAPLIGFADAAQIVCHGSISATAALVGFLLTWRGEPEQIPAAQVVTFCILGFAQVLYSFTCRSRQQTAADLGFFTNPALIGAVTLSAILQFSVVLIPGLRPVFGVVALPTAFEWGLILGLSLLPGTLVEAAKWWRLSHNQPNPASTG